MSSPRRGRPGNDRDAVLRVAVSVFNARGYDGTSVGDVARELGVTKSAIYHHVDSKEALLSLAVDEGLDALEDALSDVANRGDLSAGERLRAAVRGSVVVLVEHLPAVTLLLRVHGNTPVELAALERRRLIDQRLGQMVSEAVASGEVRSDLDPALASRLVFGMVNSLTEWVRVGPETDADTIADAVTGLAFDGLVRGP